jgi:hypothetical protein
MNKLAFGFFLMVVSQGWAEDLAPRTAKTVVDDGVHLFTSPARLNRENMKTPLLCGAAVGVTMLLDKPIRDHLFPYKNVDPSEDLRRLGNYGQIAGPIIGTGFALHGLAFDSDHSKETAFLSYETFVWAGAVSGAIKFVVGRERPSKTDTPFDFNFAGHDSSFPSGHTTEAFAAATVFSEQYPEWYVYVPAYGAAAAVGFSRIYANQHWTSDVVAGAMIGTTVSHILRLRHRHWKKSAWQLNIGGSSVEFVRQF